MKNQRKYMRPKFSLIPLNVDAILTSVESMVTYDNTKVDNF